MLTFVRLLMTGDFRWDTIHVVLPLGLGINEAVRVVYRTVRVSESSGTRLDWVLPFSGSAKRVLLFWYGVVADA